MAEVLLLMNPLGAEIVWVSLGRRLENPVLEPGVEQSRAVAGNEGALLEFDAPVPCGGIGDDLAGIAAGGQRGPDEVGKAKLPLARRFR